MILLTPEIEKIRESQKRKKKNIPGCYYYGFLHIDLSMKRVSCDFLGLWRERSDKMKTTRESARNSRWEGREGILFEME